MSPANRFPQRKFGACILTASLSVAGAGAAQDRDEGFQEVETAEAFAEAVVNRRLVYEDRGWVSFLETGRMTGDFAGSAVDGIWEWREGKVCHHLSVGRKKYDATCKTAEIDGRKIRFIREDGTSYGMARIR